MLLRSRLLFAPSWTSALAVRTASNGGDAGVAAKVDGAGQKSAGELVDDGASIQIILEPRMIEKNSVRSLVR